MAVDKSQTAALMCRVSTREQEEGYSLDAQERLLHEYCERKGLNVSFTLCFSESASKYMMRKKFREFVADVRRLGICHIVAEKADRVTRSGSRDAALVDDWFEKNDDNHLHLVKQALDVHRRASSATKFAWAIHLAVAKHTSDNLTEEVTKSADMMLKYGIWPSSTKTGYVRIKGHPVTPIQPDPSQGPLISELFQLYDQGDWSIPRLADKMYEIGLRNTHRKKVQASRIHLILQDVFYKGQMKFRGKVWPGAHQPLVSEQLFDRVQTRLHRRLDGIGAAAYSKHDHLMRGICTCQGCKTRLTWEIHRGKTYGNCRRKHICTDRAMMSEASIEVIALAALQGLVVSDQRLSDWIFKGLQATDVNGMATLIAKRKDLELRLAALERKIERLLELRIDDEIDRVHFESKRDDILLEKENVAGQLRELSNNPQSGFSHKSQIYLAAQTFHSDYLAALAPRRREILRDVFDDIVVSRASVEPRYRNRYKKLFEAIDLTNRSKTPKNFTSGEPNFEHSKIASEKKKSRPLVVGNPFWYTAWENFLRDDSEIVQLSNH